MTKWNLPPLAKVYEALSAVADDRVRLTGDAGAEVLSSERDKTYAVKWTDTASGALAITSNDNATRWQGYSGYPIIAVLLKTGRIAYDAAIAGALAGVPWHTLNQQFKRDYDAAIAHVLAQITQRGGDAPRIEREARRIYDELAKLGLERPAPKRRTG